MKGEVPRLHAIATDEVLDAPGFAARAEALVRAAGAGLALHLRAHGRPGGALLALAERLAPAARAGGTLLVLNDRLDVALALGAGMGPASADRRSPEQGSADRGGAIQARLGVQLGARSLALEVVLETLRPLLPAGLRFGYSAHAAGEAAGAARQGADWVLLGTIYATPSHAGRPGAGTALVAAAAAVTAAPLVAIGGLTPERVPEVVAAGAHGVAVLRGIWSAPDPAAAGMRYLEVLDANVKSRS